MTLMLLTFLLPLAGGAALPLLNLDDRRRRSIYVQVVTTATSVLALCLLIARPTESLTLLHMTDSLALTLRRDGAGRIINGVIAFQWARAPRNAV